MVKDIPDTILHNLLRNTNITFWNYAGYVALGHHPKGFFEDLFALVYEVVFSILIGMIFSYFASWARLRHYLIWGAFYGAIVWFVIRGAVLAFHIEPLRDSLLATSVLNSLDSVLYGIILGYVVHRLDKRVG